MTINDFNALVMLARKMNQAPISNDKDYRNFRFNLMSDESRLIADSIIGLPTNDIRIKNQADSIKTTALKGL